MNRMARALSNRVLYAEGRHERKAYLNILHQGKVIRLTLARLKCVDETNGSVSVGGRLDV